MTIEEFNQNLTDVVANLDNQAKVTEILDNLRTDYTEQLATISTTSENFEKLTQKYNDTLEVNNKLFLKAANLGDIIKNEKPPEKPEETIEEQPKMKFEDLVNDEGELM